MNKKKLAVIRALDLRIIQAEHAACFRKFDPFFISNDNKEIAKFLKRQKANYINLKMTPLFLFDPVKFLFKETSHQSWLVFDQKSLVRALKSMDVYQIQEPFFLYSGQVAQLAAKFKKPLICTPWMCFKHPSTITPPYCFAVQKVIKETDLFILRTKRVDQYLSQFRIPDKKKALIYHGVNTKRFFPAKKRSGAKVRILFVGILHQSKGLDDLLEIFPKLVKKSKKEIELVVCGTGELGGRVIDMAKNWPIDYKGYVSNLDLPAIYRKADIFCGPSKDWYFLGVKRWEEGFGFVFAEAMASGLPIVTNDCGAVKEVVGGDNLVNSQGDKKALLKSLLELINDSKKRLDIGNKNRDRAVKLFELETQIAKEEKLILKRFI